MELRELDTLPTLSQKNLASRELGKEHWQCYIVTQIERSRLPSCFLLAVFWCYQTLTIHLKNNNDNIIINFRWPYFFIYKDSFIKVHSSGGCTKNTLECSTLYCLDGFRGVSIFKYVKQ